ncbi:MAG: ornithine carbamoyltransferase [Cenarchaeum symbiont of Oopsacas minuta]|nr:ornithine carbamoyltransferase [Cenarchaeum symbiont of Oopsacas minuta]
MTKKDFLTFDELSAKETMGIISLASSLKKRRAMTSMPLKGKTLAMIFEKPSTRTRVSFEVGMYQLGGNSVILSSDSMQLSRGESHADTARTLSRYADILMARVFDHRTVVELAKYSSIPVINGLSNSFHPCQILADLLTVHEKKKKLDGLKVAWIGDGNNVCNSWLYGCAKTGMKITVASPKGYAPDANVVRDASKSTTVNIMTDPAKAVKDADVVVTDTFTSIHDQNSSKKTKAFVPKYRVGRSLMSKASKDAIFMHCLPAKRGREVEALVIDGKRSVVWDETENRLHTQKALLLYLTGASAI